MSSVMMFFDRVAEDHGYLIARLTFGLLFLVTGMFMLFNFNGTASAVASVGLPFAPLCVLIALALKLGGSTSLILGYHIRYGVLALIVFILLTMVFFHLYDLSGFLKNLALIGGLVLVYRSTPKALPLSSSNPMM